MRPSVSGTSKAPDILLRTRYMKARPAPSGLLAFGAVVTGSTRSSDGLDPRRRRLLYRSWHRGTREMDLIMGRFADTAIADLSAAELDEFERLSGVPDDELYSWIIRGAAPADYDGKLFRRLCDFQFRRNER
jgi:antitoxin CptB